jgi:hypothetical protein
MRIDQIVHLAGNGELRDNSECSNELRKFMETVDSQHLASYARHCAQTAFPNSGRVLQDIVNELGRRLGFSVKNGLYQGRQGAIGFDGLWKSANATLVVETKTTDAYTFPLETLGRYLESLQVQNRADDSTGVLLVVARDDTGALEAQVRGSRLAWSIRIIGLEALIKLVQVAEESVGTEVIQRIHSLLLPIEYTRLDRMVEVVFAAVEDKELASASEGLQAEQPVEDAEQSGTIPQRKLVIAEAYGRLHGHALVRRRFSLFSDPNNNLRAVVSVSRRYNTDRDYWYAYLPVQSEWLAGAPEGVLLLGLMDRPDEVIALPRAVIEGFVPQTHVRDRPGRRYWDIYLRIRDDRLFIWLPLSQREIDLTSYLTRLTPAT